MTGSQLLQALEISRFVKDHSSTPVVWGGVHASIFPEETMQERSIDYVITGEGETGLRDLVHCLSDKKNVDKVPNLVYRKSEKIIRNDAAPFLDLDAIPTPAYHLLDVRDYLHTYYYEKEVIEIETSRGCPYACGFCYNKSFNKRKWRARNVDTIMNMIHGLMNDYNIRSFLAIDDSFFIDPERVKRFIDRYHGDKLDISMGYQGRIDGITRMSDRELDRFIAAGCRFLQFGVESGSPRILKLINKKLDIPDVIEVNRRLARYPNTAAFYNFMVGLPSEKREDLFMTVDLVCKLLRENPNAYIGTIHIYKEYPGTKLYQEALKEGYRPPHTLQEWGQYDWQSAVKRDKSPELMKLINGISVASYCIDDKIKMLGDSKLANIVSSLYRPVARARFKYKFFKFMPEKLIFK